MNLNECTYVYKYIYIYIQDDIGVGFQQVGHVWCKVSRSIAQKTWFIQTSLEEHVQNVERMSQAWCFFMPIIHNSSTAPGVWSWNFAEKVRAQSGPYSNWHKVKEQCGIDSSAAPLLFRSGWCDQLSMVPKASHPPVWGSTWRRSPLPRPSAWISRLKLYSTWMPSNCSGRIFLQLTWFFFIWAETSLEDYLECQFERNPVRYPVDP